MPKYRRWHCRAGHPAAQFTLQTGTLFEASRIPLSKWIVAIWMIVNAKNGISSHEVGRAPGVTQKTAWFMGHRIRLALQQGSFERLFGDELGDEVEGDETFIGGKARNIHSSVKARRITGRGPTDKTIVLGILERGGIVIPKVVGVMTLWFADFIIFGVIYNKRYLVDLMSKGFTPADDHSRNVLAQKGIAVIGGPVLHQPAAETPAPAAVQPAPPVPAATPKRQNIENQILGAARSPGGVLTPADVAMETDCNLDKAKQQLEDLVTRGHVELRARRNGDLVYAFPSLLNAEQREALEPLV